MVSAVLSLKKGEVARRSRNLSQEQVSVAFVVIYRAVNSGGSCCVVTEEDEAAVDDVDKKKRRKSRKKTSEVVV